MEKNTVLLSLEEYNALRDFKKEIEKGNTIKIYCGYSGNPQHYYSAENALKEIEIINKQLYEGNNKSFKENIKLKEQHITELERIKKMSYWQFRKWKKS